ncbi:MAG: hypothetical protein LBD92_00160 [Oscillospiraceae bacterium]|jgi:hypothetical protein|nr:hypothetical protein [Oscillospiraceae bacterium]
MKRALLILLCLTALVPLAGRAEAVNTDMSFEYALTANGKRTVSAAPGDTVVVSLALTRTDSSEGFPMYAAQCNLRYDSGFFELVPGSVESAEGVAVNTVSLGGAWDGWTGVSAAAYSALPEGEMWANTTRMLTFRLKATRVGSSAIISEDCVVSTADGLDGYALAVNNAVVDVKGDGNSGSVRGAARRFLTCGVGSLIVIWSIVI